MRHSLAICKLLSSSRSVYLAAIWYLLSIQITNEAKFGRSYCCHFTQSQFYWCTRRPNNLFSPESSLAVEKGKGAVDHPLHALVKTLHKLEASLHLCQRKLPPEPLKCLPGWQQSNRRVGHGKLDLQVTSNWSIYICRIVKANPEETKCDLLHVWILGLSKPRSPPTPAQKPDQTMIQTMWQLFKFDQCTEPVSNPPVEPTAGQQHREAENLLIFCRSLTWFYFAVLRHFCMLWSIICQPWDVLLRMIKRHGSSWRWGIVEATCLLEGSWQQL